MTRTEVIGDCTLMLGDCRDILPTLGRVDAVVTDPPYNGVKADDWDNQWADDADFLTWVREIAGMLADRMEFNSSLYWFASPQMAARIECVLRDFIEVKNHITWDKSEGRKGVGGTGIDVTALRCFWSASSERVIFGESRFAAGASSSADDAALDASGYGQACQRGKASVFGDYMRAEFARAKVTNKQIARLFPSKTGGMTGCVSNWLLGLNIPTAEQYETIRRHLNATPEAEFLRREYEGLRRPFFAAPGDQWGDVWRFGLDRDAEHPTQKPLDLMLHIVGISSRPDSTILDPFMGSGTTGVACARLGRKFVGIERERAYFDIACRRIEAEHRRPRLALPEPVRAPKQEAML